MGGAELYVQKGNSGLREWDAKTDVLGFKGQVGGEYLKSWLISALDNIAVKLCLNYYLVFKMQSYQSRANAMHVTIKTYAPTSTYHSPSNSTTLPPCPLAESSPSSPC